MHVDVVQLADQPGQVLVPLAGARQEGLPGEVVGHREVCLALEVSDLVDHLRHGQRCGGVPVHQLFVAQADPDDLVGVGADDGQGGVDLGPGVGVVGDVDAGLDFDRQVQAGARLQDAPGVAVGAPGADGVEPQCADLLQRTFQSGLIAQCPQRGDGEADSALGRPERPVGRSQVSAVGGSDRAVDRCSRDRRRRGYRQRREVRGQRLSGRRRGGGGLGLLVAAHRAEHRGQRSPRHRRLRRSSRARTQQRSRHRTQHRGDCGDPRRRRSELRQLIGGGTRLRLQLSKVRFHTGRRGCRLGSRRSGTCRRCGRAFSDDRGDGR